MYYANNQYLEKSKISDAADRSQETTIRGITYKLGLSTRHSLQLRHYEAPFYTASLCFENLSLYFKPANGLSTMGSLDLGVLSFSMLTSLNAMALGTIYDTGME